MATTLDDLLTLHGVVAAGEVTPDGRLVEYKTKMDMSPELAAMTAQFCATVTMVFHTLAGAFTHLSQMQWVPKPGLSLLGRRLDGGHRRQPGRVCPNSEGGLQSGVPGTRRQSVTQARRG